MRLALVSVALVLGAFAARVQAQGPAVVIVEGSEAPSAEGLREWAEGVAPVDTIDPAELRVVSEIEALVMSARRSSARLEERDALRELARAEALAERHLAIAGMAAWYAEVELAIAITAAQAGMESLAEAALRRASSIDPARTVQAAEARPELVERSREVARAIATGPRGRFELRAEAPGARGFLDDRPIGELPQVVEAAVGRHVLRVEAPGHRAYAQTVDVLEGERAPVRVSLAPTEALQVAERIERAARAGRPDDVARVLAAAGALEPPPVELRWAGEHERALSVTCDTRGCGEPRRIELGGVTSPAASLREGLRWLEAPSLPDVSLDEPWWERWYVWAGAGAVVAAAVGVIVALVVPRGQGPLVIELDTSALPHR